MRKYFDFKIDSKYVEYVSYIIDCENHTLTSTKFFKDGDTYRKEQPYPMLSILDIYDIMCDELSAMLENKSREEK